MRRTAMTKTNANRMGAMEGLCGLAARNLQSGPDDIRWLDFGQDAIARVEDATRPAQPPAPLADRGAARGAVSDAEAPVEHHRRGAARLPRGVWRADPSGPALEPAGRRSVHGAQDPGR